MKSENQHWNCPWHFSEVKCDKPCHHNLARRSTSQGHWNRKYITLLVSSPPRVFFSLPPPQSFLFCSSLPPPPPPSLRFFFFPLPCVFISSLPFLSCTSLLKFSFYSSCSSHFFSFRPVLLFLSSPSSLRFLCSHDTFLLVFLHDSSLIVVPHDDHLLLSLMSSLLFFPGRLFLFFSPDLPFLLTSLGSSLHVSPALSPPSPSLLLFFPSGLLFFLSPPPPGVFSSSRLSYGSYLLHVSPPGLLFFFITFFLCPHGLSLRLVPGEEREACVFFLVCNIECGPKS